MKIIKFIEEKFWIPVILSLLLALFLPPIDKNFNVLVIPFVMMNFFLASLKIDLLDIIKHIKKPFFIAYILVIYLLLIPIVIYLMFSYINSDLAIAMLLLASMPPGAASPMLTNIFEGNTSLSMSIALISYIISPFTIVFLFFALTQKSITLDLTSLFQALIVINFLPLIIAQIIRKFNKKIIDKTQKFYSFIGIICICIIVFIAVSQQAKEILQTSFSTLTIDISWLFLIFTILYLVSYCIGIWRNKSDKTAIAVTKTYMNNALAIGIATAFFSPKIAFLMVLSEIPWSTTLGPFKYLLKFLK